MKQGKIAHSHTRMKSFDCPKRYYMQYIKKEPAGQDVFEPGRSLHEFAAQYGKHCLTERVKTDITKAEEIALTVISKVPLEKQDDFMALVKKFVDSHKFAHENIIGIEEEVCFDRELLPAPWYSNEAWFRGKIDLIESIDNESVLITDYKTGWAVDVDLRQLKTYAWLVSKQYPHVESFRVTQDYVRLNIISDVVVFNRGDLDDWEKKILKRCDAIEASVKAGKYKAVPGGRCKTCPYVMQCSTPPSELMVTDEASATLACKTVLVLEGQLDALKSQLKAYTAEHGPLIVNDQEFGHFISHGKTWDVDKFLQVCPDPSHYLSVNNTKAKKLSEDIIDAASVPSEKTSFRHKKYKEREI